MKKTQKILALVMAVLMVVSCFGMTVFAEEEVTETEMITVVGAEKISDDEYVIEFSAPVTYKYLWSTFRRPGVENGTGQNVKPPAVEYLGEVEEIGGRKYSNFIKFTFEEAAENFDLASHGIVIAEYGQTGEAKGDVVGAISPAVVCGKNGELVMSNYTNGKGTEDFIWVPMDVADTSYTYLPHLVNTYEDDVVLLGAEVSEDFTTYTVHFSAPVKIPQSFRLFLRTHAEGGPPQPSSPTIEYIDGVKYASGTYSKTIKLTFAAADVSADDFKEATLDYTKMGLVFTEYDTSTLAQNIGYLAPSRLASVNGRKVKGNHQNASNYDFIWIPLASKDTENAFKVHLSQGNPIALDATWHAETEEILVTFSESVSFAEEGAYLCVGGPESETKVALTASATDKDNVVAFTVGELPEAFAEGKYGIAFADGYIKDAGEKALEANFIGEEANFFYIPTASADAENEYPLNLDVHTAAKMESDAENHWTVCECGEILAGSTTAHDYKVKSDAETHWTECECGAKTEATAHEYTEVNKDAETHWAECVCGAKTEAAAHEFETKKDAETHWTECVCGAKTEATAHDYKVKSDAETHWTECECGAKTEAAAHEFETKSDAETHWTECECGAKTEAAAHDYKVKSDAETHWTECECGAKTEAAAHEFETKSDAETHWTECECGAKTEAAAHEFETKSDAENHWKECACGAKAEVAAHDYKVKSDAETHWTECECGAKTEAVAHEFETKKDDETHWTECVCGAKTEAEAHDFSESNTCPVCGEESYIAGDVDGNDKVEAADAIHLLYYTFFGAERYPVNQPCDFDGNGEVEAADAIYLLYFTFFGAERYPLN